MAGIVAALAECDIEAGRPEAFVWEWGRQGIDQSSGYPALAEAQACLREDAVAVGIARVITASGGGVVAGFSWVSCRTAGRRSPGCGTRPLPEHTAPRRRGPRRRDNMRGGLVCIGCVCWAQQAPGPGERCPPLERLHARSNAVDFALASCSRAGRLPRPSCSEGAIHGARP